MVERERRLMKRVREASHRFRPEGTGRRFFRAVPGPAERDDALARVAPALRGERLLTDDA